MHWCGTRGLKARPLDIVGYGDEEEPGEAAAGETTSMNRFAELLDRLAYEPGRNNKLRLMTDYFRSTTPDPERGWALAALTGSLSFPHAKAGSDPQPDRRAHRSGAVRTVLRLCRRPFRNRRADVACENFASPHAEKRKRLSLTTVIETLTTLGKAQLPQQLARWLDALDETGRWALIKLVTGGLRIGVSARLAKAAVAALADKDAHEIELIWPGLAPPYRELFAWLEGRAEKPASNDPAPFRPPMLAHALDDADLPSLDASEFMAEWKWDGIRVQAVAGHAGQQARRTTDRAALFAHRRRYFQELSPISSTRYACPAPSTANS